MRRLLLALTLCLAVAAVGVAVAVAPKKGSRAYTASVTYTETNGGKAQGESGAVKGIKGKGKFSAKLSPGAAMAAFVIGAATGVPVADVAKGGSYVVKRDIDANGKITGVLLVKYKAPGLGSSCLTYTEKPGRFNGGSFVPMSGTLKAVGGTGKAAKWRASIGFNQTSVSGEGTEQFKAKGAAKVSTGAKKGLSAACRKLG